MRAGYQKQVLSKESYSAAHKRQILRSRLPLVAEQVGIFSIPYRLIYSTNVPLEGNDCNCRDLSICPLRTAICTNADWFKPIVN